MSGSVKEEAGRGSNDFIKEGAKLIERAQVILDEILPQVGARLRVTLSVGGVPSDSREPLGKEDVLVYEVRSVDAVLESTGLSASQVAATLPSMELCGRGRQLPGQ